SPPAADFLTTGDRRGVRAMALSHLVAHAASPVAALAMPAGSPFGDVVLDATKCTLCMACTQACPTSALRADPERPRLSFHEAACVQCGLCRSTCPEAAIALVPRLSFESRGGRVLKEGEPARCVRCDKEFGILGVIERMAEALADRHPMFMGEAARRLRMCEDCRVVVQFETGDNPMAGATPPRPRTTEDDLRERDEKARS
ncbi:MAG: 4Fe-4S dicluster domain-containing protein, partial [Alphaproteobacteria bacterium]|nr:4Fe-4S dicluster domain-containing protein [Alphaproteobacteria bacterium]